MESLSISKEASIDFIAGWIGGAACAYVGQPMDTVKVKIQTHPHLYSSAVRCALHTIRKEGFMKLYAGSVPAVIANVAENSVLFLCYGQCTKLVAQISGTNKDEMTLVQTGLSGSIAAFFAAFALCPAELVKCRMQTLSEVKSAIGSNPTLRNVIRCIYHQEGLMGFFRGLTPTIARDVPGYFFFFGGYEAAKYALAPQEPTDTKNVGLVRTILAGGFGGLSFWAACYPVDVVKTRMQVFTTSDKQSASAMQVVRVLAKEGGLFAFYRGIGPTLFRSFPANGALFLFYEYSKDFMYWATLTNV